MPIFEFKCEACGREFERVVFGSDEQSAPCPECGSDNTKKQLSVFSCTGMTDGGIGSCGPAPTGGFS